MIIKRVLIVLGLMPCLLTVNCEVAWWNSLASKFVGLTFHKINYHPHPFIFTFAKLIAICGKAITDNRNDGYLVDVRIMCHCNNIRMQFVSIFFFAVYRIMVLSTKHFHLTSYDPGSRHCCYQPLEIRSILFAPSSGDSHQINCTYVTGMYI